MCGDTNLEFQFGALLAAQRKLNWKALYEFSKSIGRPYSSTPGLLRNSRRAACPGRVILRSKTSMPQSKNSRLARYKMLRAYVVCFALDRWGNRPAACG